MYLPSEVSRAREREAEKARANRLEIVKAVSIGQITRRDLFRWGILTATGMIAAKHGLSPFVRSAYAAVPTGTPRSPLYGAAKFSTPLPRGNVLQPTRLYEDAAYPGAACFPDTMSERPAKRLSYHTDFNEYRARYGAAATNPYCNPKSQRGPCEGRPFGDWFAHQRWNESWMRPQVGYVMTWGRVAPNSRFHPLFPAQNPDSVWCYGSGSWAAGNLAPPLIRARYGEPVLTRVYNNTPLERESNGGFGRNETSLHLHNAHTGAESDGASNAHHFPGTFYDYAWPLTLARHDHVNKDATDPRASGPSDNGSIIKVPGDYREIQSSIWFHDHRFFFTAENVYKGNFGLLNLYSGPDRGNEEVPGGYDSAGSPINLRLPSGKVRSWGNIDFDVNLAFSNVAFDQSGQLYFDVFDTAGFLGDIIAVNGAYAPYLEVLPRKYRFRCLNASMSRYIKLALIDGNRAVPFHFIANDGNLVANPITLTALDQQGPGERYDIIVDFTGMKGRKLQLINLLLQTSGEIWKKEMSISDALKGKTEDPCLGSIMEFRVVDQITSIDAPGQRLTMASPEARDTSRVPGVLTSQIPIVAPVRERVIEWKRGGGEIDDPSQCFPDCGEAAAFPWTVRVNGESAHNFNANRISLLVPCPGEVEHWTYVNGGGGWDHPIHLHFEEGVTINRGGAAIPLTERGARKDVWRLRPGGQVKFQVRFGEYGGAYVQHCHNTVHEDFAMMLRYQLRTDRPTDPQYGDTLTPRPTEDGVIYYRPTTLPEGVPKTVTATKAE